MYLNSARGPQLTTCLCLLCFLQLGLKSLNTKNPLMGAKDTKNRVKQRKDGRQEGELNDQLTIS